MNSRQHNKERLKIKLGRATDFIKRILGKMNRLKIQNISLKYCVICNGYFQIKTDPSY